MNFDEFKQIVSLSKQDLYQKTFSDNKETIRVKNEKTVLKNLERIFCAALKISNRNGFQAMSMRDLSREANLSMGALYAYFSSKEELLGMIQRQGDALVRQVMDAQVKKHAGTMDQLHAVVRTHLYLSEVMQPWFYFSFMENKNLNEEEQNKMAERNRFIREMIEDVLEKGRAEGIFYLKNIRMNAGLIIALLRDWYLKREEYAFQEVSVDGYADFILEFIEAACCRPVL